MLGRISAALSGLLVCACNHGGVSAAMVSDEIRSECAVILAYEGTSIDALGDFNSAQSGFISLSAFSTVDRCVQEALGKHYSTNEPQLWFISRLRTGASLMMLDHQEWHHTHVAILIDVDRKTIIDACTYNGEMEKCVGPLSLLSTALHLKS